MRIERITTVRVGVRTTIPADAHIPIKQYPHIEDSTAHFRAAFLEESLNDGEYHLWVTGPILTRSGADHAKNTDMRDYDAVTDLPFELEPLALGPAGLRRLLAEAAQGGDL